MELVGRLTADAKVSTVKDERKVVNFSIAINDSYKPKGSEMVTKITTFVNCSYWINPAIAEHLTKSTLVLGSFFSFSIPFTFILLITASPGYEIAPITV